MNTWSEFRMGWVITFFDLPVLEAKERKEASQFRKRLLDEGFVMLQYSVYARPCPTYDMVEKEANRILKYAPTTGNVRILFMTDAQWGKVLTVECEAYAKNRKNPGMPDQIEFW